MSRSGVTAILRELEARQPREIDPNTDIDKWEWDVVEGVSR